MFEHAKIVHTRWGLGLCFIDLNDETDVEVLRFQVWGPLADDGSEARAVISLGLNPEASDEAHSIMSHNNRAALINMDRATFEQALEQAGIAATLDAAFMKHPEHLPKVYPDTFDIMTGDPLFDPNSPVIINGYMFMRYKPEPDKAKDM